MAIVNVQHDEETQQAAEEWSQRYKERWHPSGYGTTLRPPVQVDLLTWRVTGWRASSCD